MQEFSAEQLQEVTKLLQQLPGVFAARLIASPQTGEVEAIHILADSARNAKQVVRDVQAALSAMYALDIDHRIVSVAQMPMDPLPPQEPEEPGFAARICCSELSYHESTDGCVVSVSLDLDGKRFTGRADGRCGHRHPELLAAAAALDAIHQLVGQGEQYALLSVQQVQTVLSTLSVVVFHGKGEDVLLSGAASVSHSALHSAVRATLNALQADLDRRFAGMILQRKRAHPIDPNA